MKRVLAVLLVVAILLSTGLTAGLIVSAGSSSVKTTTIDLTQAPAVTNMGGTSTSAVSTDGKWVVTINNYVRKLSDCTPNTSQTWLPNIALRDSDGNALTLGVGNKVIVEVKYKVLSYQANAAWATSIGIGGWFGTAGSNLTTAVYKSHPDAADVGKEFTLLSVATVANNSKVPKIAFSGGGQLEISSITVHELPAANINDYVVVKYMDDGVENNEFAPKNGALKAPVKDGYTFDGWYADADFSGEAVTAVTADTTLYAKWSVVSHLNTVNVDLSQTPNFYKPGSGAENTTFTAEGDVLKVHAAYYNSQYAFDRHTNGNNAWLPHYKVYDNGSFLLPVNSEGTKVSVEVQYRLVGSDVDGNFGAQIGIVTGSGGNEYKYHKTYKKHVSTDLGKEFSLSTAFTVLNGSDRAIKLAFLGRGDFEITSIVVKYVVPAHADDYAAVQYIDNGKASNELVLKNGALKTPVKDGYTFDGWYTDADFIGDAVTAVTADTTLYAKWVRDGDRVVIDFHDSVGNGTCAKNYIVGDRIDVVPTKAGYNFLGWYKNSNYVGRPVEYVSEDLMNLYAKWEETDPQVDIPVDLAENTALITTGNTAQSTVTLDSDKLAFYIQNYERQLNTTNTATSDSWFPSYYFKNSGQYVQLVNGETYEFEVSYKVVKISGGDDIGLQIGLGADYQVVNRTRIKGYKVHTKSDEGKEFTYTTSYTCDNRTYPKLIFSGHGELEVTSVRIKRVLPIMKDTVIGTQTYEEYAVGVDTGVIGDKKGTEVSKEYNHTSGLLKNKSLKLQLNTNMSRLTGNTVISLNTDGQPKPFAAKKGAAYVVTFYMYANKNMNDLIWSVNSVGDTLKGDYLSTYQTEICDKVSLVGGRWQKITAYIPVLKGCSASQNLISIAVASNDYDGSYVYIDDVEIKQLLDSEVISYNAKGGVAPEPQRAFAGEKLLSFREPTREGYLFNGWYYDEEYQNEAKVTDRFPADKSEMILYAKWIEAPTTAADFAAGTFDQDIYAGGVSPYENAIANSDAAMNGQNNKTMTQSVAWVADAGIYGNGTAENDGALCFSNEAFSAYFDATGYNAVRLMNADGTPFVVVKGARYTLSFDYIFASHKGISYMIPVISEKSAYAGIGYNSYQTLDRVSVMETDTDYMTYSQSFVANRTGYVYLTLTGRDDNAVVDTHCYEKVYVDNVRVNVNNDVVKLDIKAGNEVWYTKYGIKGQELTIANALKKDGVTFDGFYTDPDLTQKFNGLFPNTDSTIYIRLKTDLYDTPSDFSGHIVVDFEETELLKDFYRQSKYMTSWSRETQNEWLLITDDAQNAFSGKNYIKLNGYSHYWNQAKFVLYDTENPSKVMLLDKGEKYRVKVMVRCEDVYEMPVNMTLCLENPASRYLLAENGNIKLKYDPTGDKDGYYLFFGDIEVRSDMAYYPSLAIRRNANDLQSLYIDSVSVEKLRDCTVKFESNGGTSFDEITVQTHDLLFDPGVPYREGYVFEGWYRDTQFSQKWDFDNDTVANDMILYAKWSVAPPEKTDTDTGTDDPVIPEPDDPNGGWYPDTDTDNLPPDILKADPVIVENNKNGTQPQKAGLPVWVIILIISCSVLVLSGAAVTVAVLLRKKARKHS